MTFLEVVATTTITGGGTKHHYVVIRRGDQILASESAQCNALESEPSLERVADLALTRLYEDFAKAKQYMLDNALIADDWEP